MKNQEKFQDVIGKALAGHEPSVKASTLVAEAPTPALPWKIRSLAAAAVLFFTLLASSMWIPGLAVALSNLPLLGDAYIAFISGTGMDVAYQAGFVMELDRQVTRDDVTLRVIGAYRDGTQDVIMFTLSSEQPGRISELWGSGHNLRPHINGLGSSTMQYEPETGMILGILNANTQKSIFGSKMTLELGATGADPAWRITFPVQTIAARHLETVDIESSFTYKDNQITVHTLTFTPARTILSYSIKGDLSANSGSTHKGVVGGGSDSKLDTTPLFNNWALEHLDGTQLKPLGGNTSGSARIAHGEAYFAPTEKRALKVYYLGQLSSGNSYTLPFEIGASTTTPSGELQIAAIVVKDNETEVKISWDDTTSLKKLGATIISPTGKKYAIQGMQPDSNGAILSFDTPIESDVPHKLYLDNIYTEDNVKIKIYELTP